MLSMRSFREMETMAGSSEGGEFAFLLLAEKDIGPKT